MRFGCCLGLASFVPPTLNGQQDSLSETHEKQCERLPSLLALLEQVGFDYVELGVGTTAPEQSEAAYERFSAAIAASRLKPEVFNSFIPPWIKVVGPEADEARIEAYVSVAVKRVAQAGAECLIFGSGGARSYPSGFPLEDVQRQLKRFLNLCLLYTSPSPRD